MISRDRPLRKLAKTEAPTIKSRTISSQFIPRDLDFAAGEDAVSLTVFLARLLCHFLRQRGRGRLFVPVNRLQVIAHVLFVVRELRSARLVSIGGPEARRIGSKYFI